MNNTDYTALLLRNSAGSELELVPEFGGLINGLWLGQAASRRNLIAGLDSRTAMSEDRIYRGVSLFPFANRLDGGHYQHLGATYQLPVNEADRNNALHGFLFNIKPSITVEHDGERNSAKLHYCYDGGISGYPFPSDVTIQYTLIGSAAMEMQFTVHNRHNQAIPVGIGWHPYFTLGCAVDELSLRLPPVDEVIVDERMLPTGEKVAFTRFAELSALGDIRLDTCFALQAADSRGIATTTLWSDADRMGLEIWQQTGQAGYNYLQLCIAPDRRSIAIEPVSIGIDGFNSGEGLIHLPANEQFSAQLGVKLLHPAEQGSEYPTT